MEYFRKSSKTNFHPRNPYSTIIQGEAQPKSTLPICIRNDVVFNRKKAGCRINISVKVAIYETIC